MLCACIDRGIHHGNAHTLCYAQVSWVRQAEDRAHRRNQVNAVNVYFLCARGTSDEATYVCLPACVVPTTAYAQQMHT